MSDRAAYTSSTKQNGTTTTNGAAARAGNPPTHFPNPTKNQTFIPTRQPTRLTPNTTRQTPYPTRRRTRRKFSCRRCFCLSCIWATIILLGILLIAATAAAAFYLLYHPHRPEFSVAAVKISHFNLTNPDDTTNLLTAKLNLTLSAKNANKKAIFYYDNASIKVLSQSVILSNTSYASFANLPSTTFIIHTPMEVKNKALEADEAKSLKSDLKRKNGLPLRIEMDTMLGVKFKKYKVRKIGIRVKCDGIKGMVPKGNSTAAANVAGAKCKVDLRIKVFKWTF